MTDSGSCTYLWPLRCCCPTAALRWRHASERSKRLGQTQSRRPRLCFVSTKHRGRIESRQLERDYGEGEIWNNGMELDLKARLIFAFHHPVLAALQGETGGGGGEGRSIVFRGTSQAHWTSVQPLYSRCGGPAVTSCVRPPGATRPCVRGSDYPVLPTPNKKTVQSSRS